MCVGLVNQFQINNRWNPKSIWSNNYILSLKCERNEFDVNNIFFCFPSTAVLSIFNALSSHVNFFNAHHSHHYNISVCRTFSMWTIIAFNVQDLYIRLSFPCQNFDLILKDSCWLNCSIDIVKMHSFIFVNILFRNLFYSSTEWNRISLSEKEKLGLTFEEDGEFW